MDPYIRYRYLDGRHDRTVEAPCSSAHSRISAGVARPLSGESTEIYLAWCQERGEGVDETDAWEDDGGAQEDGAADEDESAVVSSIEPEAETGGADGAEAEEVDPGGADPEASVAIDLRETPIRHLADALAGVDDLSVLHALASSDDRSTAVRHYAARIDELNATDQEAIEPEAETGDG